MFDFSFLNVVISMRPHENANLMKDVFEDTTLKFLILHSEVGFRLELETPKAI